MPTTHDSPQLTIYRDGLVSLNGDAIRALGEASAVMLTAPSSPGAHWLLLPVSATHPAALRLYCAARDTRQRFRAYSLAVAAFALLPEGQKTLTLSMLPAGADLFRLTAQAA
jgi:hypothetical protein